MFGVMIPRRERLPRPLFRLEREMGNLWDRMIGRDEEWMVPTEVFAPPCDVSETEKEFEVKVELPGMKPEDVTVEVKNGELWISGKKEEEKEEKGKTYHRVERRYGEFRRVIPLGEVEVEKIGAKFHDGVLKVTVPKVEEIKPKRIEVKA
jgi:HSP20 family protein